MKDSEREILNEIIERTNCFGMGLDCPKCILGNLRTENGACTPRTCVKYAKQLLKDNPEKRDCSECIKKGAFCCRTCHDQNLYQEKEWQPLDLDDLPHDILKEGVYDRQVLDDDSQEYTSCMYPVIINSERKYRYRKHKLTIDEKAERGFKKSGYMEPSDYKKGFEDGYNQRDKE